MSHLLYLQDHFYFSNRLDEVTLTGVTDVTAPTCGLESLEGGNDLIGIAVGSSDHIWQLLVAAKPAGTPVTMKISDVQLDKSGHCHLISVYAI